MLSSQIYFYSIAWIVYNIIRNYYILVIILYANKLSVYISDKLVLTILNVDFIMHIDICVQYL